MQAARRRVALITLVAAAGALVAMPELAAADLLAPDSTASDGVRNTSQATAATAAATTISDSTVVITTGALLRRAVPCSRRTLAGEPYTGFLAPHTFDRRASGSAR